MALLEELGTDAKIVQTDRGTIRAFVLSPTTYVTIVTGHMEDAHADMLLAFGDQRVRNARGQKLRVFHDWVEMTGYESRCRQRLTSWSVEHLSAFGEVHLALRSKIVAMGVQVANIALGGFIRTYTDRAAVEMELRRAMRVPLEATR